MIVSSWFIRIFTRGFASAITLWPFIIIKSSKQKNDLILLNHEMIHLVQQRELLIIFFYLLYFYEYVYYRYLGHSHYEAYMRISLEREAYMHEADLTYLKKRNKFSFRQYWH